VVTPCRRLLARFRYQIEGDAHFGVPFEQYKADLNRREQEVKEELKQAQADERRILEIEKAEIERRLADTQASYQAHIKELKERIGQLETIRGQVPDALLDQARAALAQGDQSEADRLFAQFEEQSTRDDDESTRTAAEVAYQLSRIARDNIRYREAYAHAQRAVRLAPENSIYLSGAGKLARILGDYLTAKDYHEQALAGDLQTYGEDHPRVATIRNNLGLVLQNLGEYQKAIGYLEQALTSNLKTYGKDHPDVAIRHNNLGSAWQVLGEYEKAIGYYEQALASDLQTYGEDHPKVAIRRNNLGSAWQALGEYEKAIGYFEQALAVFERKLGPEHPYTKGTRDHLATARAEQARANAAGRKQVP